MYASLLELHAAVCVVAIYKIKEGEAYQLTNIHESII